VNGDLHEPGFERLVVPRNLGAPGIAAHGRPLDQIIGQVVIGGRARVSRTSATRTRVAAKELRLCVCPRGAERVDETASNEKSVCKPAPFDELESL